MAPLLPDSVTNLLKSTRYVHLGTCRDNVPHVSLMNYTYLHRDGDFVIFSTPENSTKYQNIVENPHVSLLVHDWISAKSLQAPTEPREGRRNSLYELLANINKNEISSVSVMLDGKAQILATDDPNYGFYRSLHSNNNQIDQDQAKTYIDCDNALVVVEIEKCKVTDTNNNVQEY